MKGKETTKKKSKSTNPSSVKILDTYLILEK